jgi:lycopene elongase/hydratase (dihydrobisanhydrobacterioruberin-forming)
MKIDWSLLERPPGVSPRVASSRSSGDAWPRPARLTWPITRPKMRVTRTGDDDRGRRRDRGHVTPTTSTLTSRNVPPPAAPPRRPAPVAVLAVLRPWYWPASWGPAMLGYVLGSGTWGLPDGDVVRYVAAALVLGPLVWGAVLATNDRHDLATDHVNPRKATTPAVTGAIGDRDLARLQIGFGVAALAGAAVVGGAMVLGTAGVLALGWAYSAPPLRLKGRAGADVATNALVVGFLAPLCGWSLHHPPAAYPPALAVTGTLIAAALYIPTTVIDRDADRDAGDRTFAVRFGPRVAYRAGVGAWAASTALWLIGCADGLVPASQLPWHVLCCAVMLVLYAVLMRRPSIIRLAVVFTVFAVPAALFLGAVVAGHPLAGVLAR